VTELYAQTIPIAELMIKAGFLSDNDLTEALEIANDGGQRIGGVLVMCGFVTAKQLDAALAAQGLLKEGRITVDEAITSLRASK
jgi:hypothetical protein